MTDAMVARAEQAEPKEIERKFLIDALPDGLDLGEYESVKIDQGYLAVDERAAVRIRRKGVKFYITYKGAPLEHEAERIELEGEISQELFETLWPGTAGRRIEKTRYMIPYEDRIIELDLFEGDNAGYMLAEVEFVSTSQSDDFGPPDWFGTEVTADKRYGNASIADNGFPV